MGEINGYELSRIWFDWCFENPEKISPNHSALYFFCIEHCNRLGWKKKFGLPTTMAKEAIGIKSYNTYISTFHDLINWGFIELVEKSKNQFSSNIIALSKIDKAPNKALDKALIKHVTKRCESTRQSISSIDKPLTINKEQPFSFYDLELEKNKDNVQWLFAYKSFVNFLKGENELNEPAVKILAVRDQLSFEQFVKVCTSCEKNGIELRDMMNSMLNTPAYLKNKVSLSLTLQNWIGRNAKK